jgi:ketosteroid isomerase-like protein
MSQENVEALRAVYGDWERGDFSSSLALFDENATLAIDSGIPDGGVYMGPDGVLKYMSRFLAPWESLTIAGESFRDRVVRLEVILLSRRPSKPWGCRSRQVVASTLATVAAHAWPVRDLRGHRPLG